MEQPGKKKSLSEAFAPPSAKKTKFDSPMKSTVLTPLSTPERKKSSNSNFIPDIGRGGQKLQSPYVPKYNIAKSSDRYLNGQKECTFNDPIHGNITMNGLCLRIIDTKEFQRLRNLKQLGTCDYVYPGATHTRFSHSIGVSYYAHKLVTTIKTNQPYLNITESDILCVKVAGLCHDLGHGPFSHVFDGVFMARMHPNEHFHHEDWSVDIFRHLLTHNHIHISDYGLTPQDQLFIEEIIRGTKEKDRQGRCWEKFYLYDIVNNSRSGLDVDKLDYFRRDIRHTNVDVNSSDFQRFFENARVLRAQPIEPTVTLPSSSSSAASSSNAVSHPHTPPPVTTTTTATTNATSSLISPLFAFINTKAELSSFIPTTNTTANTNTATNTAATAITKPIQDKRYPYMICFPEKMINDSINLFALRYQLHQKVYTHKSVKKVEYMLVDALEKADPYIHIPGTITVDHADGLYKISECIQDPLALSSLDDRVLSMIELDIRPELKEAQMILQRIYSRDFVSNPYPYLYILILFLLLIVM